MVTGRYRFFNVWNILAKSEPSCKLWTLLVSVSVLVHPVAKAPRQCGRLITGPGWGCTGLPSSSSVSGKPEPVLRNKQKPRRCAWRRSPPSGWIHKASLQRGDGRGGPWEWGAQPRSVLQQGYTSSLSLSPALAPGEVAVIMAGPWACEGADSSRNAR